MRGVSRSGGRHAEAVVEMARRIAAGDGPLDRVERFCRERGIGHYSEFLDAVLDEDEELWDWATKFGRGQVARMRGIKARVAKVRRELERKE